MDLALETSTRQASLALGYGDQVWARSLESGAAHASDLLPCIEELLDEHGLDKRNIHLIHVGIGPGSFTGLRVAAALALGLARATQARLVARPFRTSACLGASSSG